MELSIGFAMEVLIMLFEVFIFYFASYNLFNKRTDNKLIRYSISILLVVFAIFISLNYGASLVKYAYVLIMFSIIMNILFYNNGNKINSMLSVVLLVVLIFALIMISDFFFVLIIKFLTNSSIDEIIVGDVENIFVLAFASKLLTLFIVNLLTRKKKNKIYLSHKQMFKFVLIFIFTILGMILLVVPSESSRISYKYMIPLILIGNNILMYYILKDFLKLNDLVRQKIINEIKFADEIKFWRKLDEKDTAQRKILHDYSETLLCIRGYIEENKIDELSDFVSNLSADFKLSTSIIKTGNSLFDILINSKYEMAMKNDVNMILKLDNLEEISIGNEDFIFLISNLISNALEACDSLENKEKEVFLSITNLRKYSKLEIVIRNPIEKEIIVENDLVKSTKEEANHGFGLINVKEIIEKYDGEGDIYVDDGYFTYIIRI